MTAEVGQFALILALLLACVQAVAPLVGAARGDVRLMDLGVWAALGQCAALMLAAGCLVSLFAASDFSVRVVAEHSNSLQPMLYKVAASWGHHEGSMLLWVLILAVFGAAVALFGGGLRVTLRARVQAVQAMIGIGFLLFVLLTSNPFDRLVPAALDGAALNPLLQDPGLAFHPPTLYIGYVGFSIAFSFCVAALIEGRVDAAWARWVRPWVLVSWLFLTAGIALGSLWAYYELGWGGWWYWDPVENASFMPWLLGTALLHSALVVERRHALVSWTILLGILTFGLSLVGTFLVRSGILTSVHAFAVDPDRGIFILAILLVYVGGALTLFAARATALRTSTLFGTVSRESSLVANNLLLAAATATVFLGTFYPVAFEAFSDDRISVGPPYFQATFVPVMLPLLALMVVGPVLKWKRDDAAAALGRLRLVGAVALLAALAVVALNRGAALLAALGVGLGLWLILGSVLVLVRRVRSGPQAGARIGRALRTTPRSVYALVLAHAGVGVTLLGITAVSAWSSETVAALRIGEQAQVGRFSVRYLGSSTGEGENYSYERASFAVVRDGHTLDIVSSEQRRYPVAEQETTEAGIRTDPFGTLYVAVGEPVRNGAVAVRLYDHPGVQYIWLGCGLMVLAGLLSLSDGRVRLGAPQRARGPFGHAVPAE